MSKINFAAVFNRKNKLDKSGEALIHIRANQNGKSIYFSTDISVKPSQWNDTKKEIRNSHPHYITLNKQINDFKDKLNDLSAKIFERQKHVTLDLLTEYYKNASRLNNSFTDFYELQVKSIKNQNTFSNENTTLKKLRAFRKNILFSDLNFELLTDFSKYLEKLGNQQNTIYKSMAHIQKYVNLAIKNDLMDLNRNPFIKFKVKKITTEREYMNTEDFIRFVNFVLPNDKSHLQRVFDMFLTALYTGLRYSDINDLTKHDVKQSINDGYYIEKEMIKTKNKVFIPIEMVFKAININVPQQNEPIEIIKRNIALNNDNNLIFKPLPMNANYGCLKELFDLIGLERYTYHAARHTIAMYLLNDVGLDITSISKLLGHKDLNTTKIYSRMSNEGLKNQLRVVFDRQTIENRAKAM